MRDKRWETGTLLAHSHSHTHSSVSVSTFAFAALATATALAFSAVAVSHLHTASPVHAVPAHVHAAIAVLQETVDGAQTEILAIDIILDGILDTETIVCLGRD